MFHVVHPLMTGSNVCNFCAGHDSEDEGYMDALLRAAGPAEAEAVAKAGPAGPHFGAAGRFDQGGSCSIP